MFVYDGFELAWLFSVAFEMVYCWRLGEPSTVESGNTVTLVEKRTNSVKPNESSPTKQQHMHNSSSLLSISCHALELLRPFNSEGPRGRLVVVGRPAALLARTMVLVEWLG